MAGAKPRYVTLDGLRGVAALAVVVGHCGTVLRTPLWRGTTAIAVDFFFMLSGFVLLGAYRARLARPGWLKPYLVARLIRLHPLIVLSTVLAAACMAAGGEVATPRLLLLAIEGAVPMPAVPPDGWTAPMMPVNPPTWSLFFEYLASLALGLGLWRRVPARWLTALAAAALVYGLWRLGTINAGFSYATLPMGVARTVFAFGVGAAVFHLRGLDRLPKAPFAVLGPVLAALLLCPGNRPYVLLCLLVLLPAILIAGARASDRPQFVAHWSGELSYPLYLLHFPVLLLVMLLARPLGFDPAGWGAFAGAVAGSVALSWVALVGYDRPVRRWLTDAYNAHHARHVVRERVTAP